MFLIGIAPKSNESSNSSVNSKAEETFEPKAEEEEDPFAEDDSFLVECSQAIDKMTSSNATSSSNMSSSSNTFNSSNSLDSNSNHKFKLPEAVKKHPSPQTLTFNSKSKTSTVAPRLSTKPIQNGDSSVFDEDDSEEFEMLLSQFELPAETASSKSASNAAETSKPIQVQPPPRSVLNQPDRQNLRVNTNLVNIFELT